MKKIVLPLAAMALVVLLSLGVSGSMPKDAGALTAKPNIVFILTDDMRKDDLKYMPQTRSLLQDKGMSFENAFVTNALCCPSRATTLRGQYAHNTGIWSNANNSAEGGWQAYHDLKLDQDDLASQLTAAGYSTALIGKYLNGYKTADVPPGWDRWFATWGAYFDYDVNDQGTITHYGTSDNDYKTDVLAREAEAFIDTSATAGKPFFAYVAPKAPHNEEGQAAPVPAPRHQHDYDGLKAPRPPSFNEQDVSDKPSWIRQLPKLSATKKAQIDNRYEKRAESLQAVDDLVAGVVGKLEEKGVMNNTYIFFTSDNGFHHGEHRIPGGKARPYEEDINMPLLVRGPGVAAGCTIGDLKCRTTYKLALNTDYLPTFTDLAGAQTPPYVDGRSLKPVLDESATSWRSAILLEAHHTVEGGATPASSGIRTVNSSTTTKGKYVEYEGTERELYDLKADPYELTNKYPATKPSAGLVSRLQALKS